MRRANAKREENNLIQCDSLLLPAHCHVFLPGFAFGFFLFALSFLSRFFFPRAYRYSIMSLGNLGAAQVKTPRQEGVVYT